MGFRESIAFEGSGRAPLPALLALNRACENIVEREGRVKKAAAEVDMVESVGCNDERPDEVDDKP